MSIENKFGNLNFGTKPTTSETTEVNVEIDPNVMLGDFASAYAAELRRRNPIRANEINLSADELSFYFQALLYYRVKSVHDDLPEWRLLKQCYWPAWIQQVATMIGQVINVDYGFIIMPKWPKGWEFTLTRPKSDEVDAVPIKDTVSTKNMLDKVLAISSRLRSFVDDGLGIAKDAFPRSREGDEEVMMMAVIDGYVKGMKTLNSPIATYVTAFLGMKLQEEAMLKILYRVRYDDIKIIKSFILSEDTLRS